MYRWAYVFGTQLFVTGSTPAGSGVFVSPLPRATGATFNVANGFPTTMTLSPYGLAAFDRDGNGDADVLFVADDRTPASGGGLLYWRLIGGTWTMQPMTVTGLTNGLRGLTGRINGSDYVLYATTTESRARLLRLDVSVASATASLTAVSTAPLNTTYRSVVLAPR